MSKITRFILSGLYLLMVGLPASAQILNGDFSNGFTNWTVLGSPQVLTSGGPTPPSGTTQAQIQSLDGDGTLTVSPGAVATGSIVTPGTLDYALGVTLPGTFGSASSDYPGPHDAIDGQAIYQVFNLATGGTLNFSYAFQSNDNEPYDSAGYVLDGVYTQLGGPTQHFNQPIPPATAYQSLSLNLAGGSHTLGFVSYNTGDNSASTSLFVANVSTVLPVPEPQSGLLVAIGALAIILWRRRSPRRA